MTTEKCSLAGIGERDVAVPIAKVYGLGRCHIGVVRATRSAGSPPPFANGSTFSPLFIPSPVLVSQSPDCINGVSMFVQNSWKLKFLEAPTKWISSLHRQCARPFEYVGRRTM